MNLLEARAEHLRLPYVFQRRKLNEASPQENAGTGTNEPHLHAGSR